MSEQDLKTALEMHAESDENHFGMINERFDAVDQKFERLEERLGKNHKELLVAVTEMKAANATSGMKSGILTSGVLVAVFEAIKQVFMK